MMGAVRRLASELPVRIPHPFEDGPMPVRPAFPVRLIDGYRDFLTGRMPIGRDRFRVLVKRRQSAAVMIIGCCDSRVSPDVIFDTHQGELFVLRNIANLVKPYTSDV